jgi:aminoglycoside 6'-N-acetyltransferase I
LEQEGMKTRTAQEEDLQVWVTLRQALWPEASLDALQAEARALLAADDEICFLGVDEEAHLVGFLEGAIHPSSSGPYGHVEGWYVRPECRRQGYGKALMGQFEQWCLHRAIGLLTSDTTASYPLSPQAHAGCGLRLVHELKIFLKELHPAPQAASRQAADSLS